MATKKLSVLRSTLWKVPGSGRLSVSCRTDVGHCRTVRHPTRWPCHQHCIYSSKKSAWARSRLLTKAYVTADWGAGRQPKTRPLSDSYRTVVGQLSDGCRTFVVQYDILLDVLALILRKKVGWSEIRAVGWLFTKVIVAADVKNGTGGPKQCFCLRWYLL